jgi:hypothetical protein
MLTSQNLLVLTRIRGTPFPDLLIPKSTSCEDALVEAEGLAAHVTVIAITPGRKGCGNSQSLCLSLPFDHAKMIQRKPMGFPLIFCSVVRDLRPQRPRLESEEPFNSRQRIRTLAGARQLENYEPLHETKQEQSSKVNAIISSALKEFGPRHWSKADRFQHSSQQAPSPFK